MKYKVKKFRAYKCRKKRDISWNILAQYNFKSSVKVNASDLYMPEDEQDKMEEWFKSNLKCLKIYPREILDKRFPWVRLDIFPCGEQ